MAQISVYFPDDVETKEIMVRVKRLMKDYRIPFSKIVQEGLRLVVSVNRLKPTGDTIRDAKLRGGFGLKK